MKFTWTNKEFTKGISEPLGVTFENSWRTAEVFRAEEEEHSMQR